METLSKNAERVQEYIRKKGFDFQVKELPDSTRTAADAAKALGCDIAQIAKSLVFMDENQGAAVLVIASGTNRVDLMKILKQTGRLLTRADGKTVKERVGFAIGGVPPAGHKEKLLTLLDQDLKQYPRIWAAAGTPNAVFELGPEDLAPMTDGLWMDLSEA